MSKRSYRTGRTEVLPVRVTPEEKEEIARRANLVGMSMSDYARTSTLGTTSPIEVAASYSVTNEVLPQLNQLESAIAQVKAALSPQEDDTHGQGQ